MDSFLKLIADIPAPQLLVVFGLAIVAVFIACRWRLAHSAEPTSSTDKCYDVLNSRAVVLNAAIGGILGAIFTIGPLFKWFRLLVIDGARGFRWEDLELFFFGIVILSFITYTLRQVFRLRIMDNGAFQFETHLGRITVMPKDIRRIRTGRQLIWWEGNDARVIHLTLDRRELSVPNFDGAEALFKQLLSAYPNILAGELDFRPDISG